MSQSMRALAEEVDLEAATQEFVKQGGFEGRADHSFVRELELEFRRLLAESRSIEELSPSSPLRRYADFAAANPSAANPSAANPSAANPSAASR